MSTGCGTVRLLQCEPTFGIGRCSSSDEKSAEESGMSSGHRTSGWFDCLVGECVVEADCAESVVERFGEGVGGTILSLLGGDCTVRSGAFRRFEVVASFLEVRILGPKSEEVEAVEIW